MGSAMLVAGGLGVLGLALLLSALAAGPAYRYLRTLGLGFLCTALLVCLPAAYRLPLRLAAGAAFAWALGQAVIATRARLSAFRREQQQREAAFGEFLEAVARGKR